MSPLAKIDLSNYQYSALVEPLSVAWHSVTRSPVQKGDTALVVGAGPIGLGIVQALKAQGIEKIIVVEVSEQRGEFAQTFGASMVLNPTKMDILGKIHEYTGDTRGADVAFETSGAQAGFDLSINGIRTRGTTVVVSIWKKPPVLNAFNLLLGEKHLIGALGYEDSDVEAVIGAIAAGKSCVANQNDSYARLSCLANASQGNSRQGL